MHEKFSYIGAGLTAWFGKLALTTENVIALIGMVVASAFTIWTFFSNRAEQRKRTKILDNLAEKLIQNNAPPSTIAAVAKIMKTDVPTKEAETNGVE